MSEFLIQYGLFLAQTITVLFSIITIILVIASVATKNKAEAGTFIITNVNDKINETKDDFLNATLDKSAYKALLKQQKKSDKTQKKASKKEAPAEKPRLFVIRFTGDIKASQSQELREVVSAIINMAHKTDEVLVVLESPGGYVPHYGLAASQLSRIRDQNIHLTIAIDRLAASGGYLMACVANQIIAAPFAIVGSIGVIAQLPNFHKLLEKNNINFEQHTAGKYKRTLTMFGENTDDAREKFKQDLEETHDHFKSFIRINRPQVDLDQVATGEHWLATKAQELMLVDEIKTSDDFILQKNNSHKIFEVKFIEKPKLKDKLAGNAAGFIESILHRLMNINWIGR